MKHRATYYLLFLSVITMSSCALFDGEELTASYLHIEPFTVTSDELTQGSPTDRIVDGWVYINDELAGVFELPATIPILESGEREISVLAGIKENGIMADGAIYPFYRSYTVDRELRADLIDTLSPTTTYPPGINFIFLERFELGNSFNQLSGSDIGLEVINDEDLVLEGSRSAVALLGGDDQFLKVGTDPLLLPPVGQLCWAELDYRTNNTFDIYVTGYYAGGIPISTYLITIAPRENWNKVYLNLGTKVNQLQANSYSLEIRATKADSLDAAWLYFDNIKIISF